MVKNYTADYILPVSTEPIKNGIVSVDNEGRIVGVFEAGNIHFRDQQVEKLDGIIVPGFVNSHCHLELSYLHKNTARQQGLIPFIQNVISQRAVDEKLREEKMIAADKMMFDNGIVAVGDVSNTEYSASVKRTSQIYYHTYLELICFEPDKARDVFDQGLTLQQKFSALPSSIVPHAPYSVCKDLFRHIGVLSKDGKNLLSMHNQESEEENKFYRYKTGNFIDFYKSLNLNIDFFKPQARDSIQSIMPLLAEEQPIMLVHNTYTSLKDIYFIRRFNRSITWCFCPNTNLYIENKLPKIEMFLFNDFNITLGTDSLASNDKLCILSELKTIQEAFPSLSLTTTLPWATINGARFLSVDDRFGSIEKGKTPGLNLITSTDGLKLTPKSKIRKLA